MDHPPPKSIAVKLLQYPYAIVAASFFISQGISFVRKTSGDWDVTYILSAHNLWKGLSIYHQHDGYIYPPFPALFALIFAYLPGFLPNLAWYAVTVVGFIFLCRWSWKLAGGPPLQGRPNTKLIEHLAFIIALIPGASYASNCISHSQTDILIGFWIIGGCVALLRGRSILAATLYGLAAAMKGPALIWFPYLIARRKPMAALWMVVVFLGANLAPNLIKSSDRHSLLFAEWAHDYLLPTKAATNVYPEVWFTESNQSILGCITRWTTTRWEWRGKSYVQRIPLNHPASPQAVKLLTLGTYGLLAIILTTALGWWPRELDRSSGSIRPRLEFGMIVILMLACSPMAAKAQWGVLMLPGFCLARLCLGRRDPILIFCFLTGWFAWLGSQNFLGQNAVFVGLWYGAVLINAIVWFLGCAYAIKFPNRIPE